MAMTTSVNRRANMATPKPMGKGNRADKYRPYGGSMAANQARGGKGNKR
jgi:hypothetical protein